MELCVLVYVLLSASVMIPVNPWPGQAALYSLRRCGMFPLLCAKKKDLTQRLGNLLCPYAAEGLLCGGYVQLQDHGEWFSVVDPVCVYQFQPRDLGGGNHGDDGEGRLISPQS